VTRAAGGIGRAMTSGPLAAGIRVAGVDRDREPAVSAREPGEAAELLTIQTDLTNDSAADEITKPRAPGSAASTSSSTMRR
jgi:NADP-dependent 3-hydroxy acid dehydrogenase YdfG